MCEPVQQLPSVMVPMTGAASSNVHVMSLSYLSFSVSLSIGLSVIDLVAAQQVRQFV